ncbi:phosphate ABC transporter permease subunit PstC [Hymenobacter sp. BT683]|uniref:Phosphate transport system permease protein n=1 Tax=Hymenobacter jeongseonensis TaxID=2791027 RepID=A0ABS0ILT7_9BACT|nr:phosphate ABC transporter permease subunit PstC [Hymenobacter jeongseonensis]MBF9239332.1 phosphate ABC transporter permease subunit PstC [Hymenobacter jeongseonensis]
MKTNERLIEALLAMSAGVGVLTTAGILWILVVEAVHFFQQVPLSAFLTDTQWTPLFADKHFGILPLVAGTLLTTAVAVAVALPLGLTIAVYLNEYVAPALRNTLKPLLEVLAAVPTVVYGFFALTQVTPFLQRLVPGLAGFNALSAGLVMGIMILPLVSSLSEDALGAVPRSLREASYAMGATRLQTAFRVVVPAASSGVTVSVVLAISRAVGETMIVAIAAGQEPRLTANPLVPIETITTYIVQVSSGDVAYGTLEYNTIFAAGITLFVLTLGLNNVGYWFRKKYQERYE